MEKYSFDLFLLQLKDIFMSIGHYLLGVVEAKAEAMSLVELTWQTHWQVRGIQPEDSLTPVLPCNH